MTHGTAVHGDEVLEHAHDAPAGCGSEMPTVIEGFVWAIDPPIAFSRKSQCDLRRSACCHAI